MDDAGTSDETHRLRQIVAAEVADLSYLVIRLPWIASDHTRPKKQNYVVLIGFGIDTDEFFNNYVKSGFFEHLTLQGIERRLAKLDASARRCPSTRRVIHPHAQNATLCICYR